MIYSDEIPTPEGYVRVLWADAQPGMEVYLIGLHHLPHGKVGPAAHGPYEIIEKHWIKRKDSDQKVCEIGERLLLKDTLYVPKVPTRNPWWRRAWNRMICSR